MTRSRKVHLVRHGKPLVDRDRPPHEWPLDPAGHAAIAELLAAGRLPTPARWFSSPEPKALGTARLLAAGPVAVVQELREHERHSTHWFGDPAEFRAVVRRAFDRPDEAAWPGWEPLAATRDRLLPAVRRILAEHPDDAIVLTGHGTAWTLLAAELTEGAPDLEAWERLRMPDVWVVDAVVD